MTIFDPDFKFSYLHEFLRFFNETWNLERWNDILSKNKIQLSDHLSELSDFGPYVIFSRFPKSFFWAGGHSQNYFVKYRISLDEMCYKCGFKRFEVSRLGFYTFYSDILA